MFPALEQGDEGTDHDKGWSHSETDPFSDSSTAPQVEVHRSSCASHPPHRNQFFADIYQFVVVTAHTLEIWPFL